MKIFKKIFLSVLCLSVLFLAAFIGYRMVFSEAKIDSIRNSDGKSDFTYYIEYKGKKYYEYSLIDFSEIYDNYLFEESKDERLTYCRHIKPFNFITFPIYGYGENNDILFRYNHGILGPPVGWVYIREDYIFPTVQNSEVSYIELGFHPRELIFLKDEDTIHKIVDSIKSREDISKILPIEEYGNYGLYVHYKDAPVYEYIGAVWDGKYMYLDEYWAWVESDEYKAVHQ